jgi:xanthine permease XanP
MSDVKSPSQDQLDLVYGLMIAKTFHCFFSGFQHLLQLLSQLLLQVFICLALGVSREDTNMILSMSLVISGIATFTM